MKLLYLSSHAILEYDQTKLWTDLGYDVFSIGAYTDPRNPAVDLRPAIDAVYHEDLAELCHYQRVQYGDRPPEYPVIDWAKANLHQGLIDWADTIIVDCYPESWIAFNWPRIRDKRVIWRTIGQSGYETELKMQQLRKDGLQIVRYSPAEKRAYGVYDWFAGEDALIRFGKDPADWYGWRGDDPVVGNLAQHDPMPHGRDQWLSWPWFEAATKGLPVKFAGPNSEKIGGLGALDYEAMREYLRSIRAYCYTGTKPASYTLGLIEAMMTGVPVVSIGKEAFGMGDLFEGHEIAFMSYGGASQARTWLESMLDDGEVAWTFGEMGRQRAIDRFGVETIGAQWLDLLGAPVRETVAA